MSLLSRIALVAALLVLVVVATVVLKTARFTSRQLTVRPVEPLSLDEAGAIVRFSRSLQFPTVSTPEPEAWDPAAFLGLHGYLQEAFPRVHAALQREFIADYSLLFRWKGSDPTLQPILLMSHIDVVPVERESEHEWSHGPFSGAVADGFVWGRGALDIKCGAVGILEAVETLLAERFQPARDVYIALGHDEEVGGRDGNALIAATLEERGVRLQYVLDEGGVLAHGMIPGIAVPVAFVPIAEKGYLGVTLTAEAAGGHSSMPPSPTAIGSLASAIQRLESRPFPAELSGAVGAMLDYLGPEMGGVQKLAIANRWLFGGLIERQFAGSPSLNALMRTTIAPTMIEGGGRQKRHAHERFGGGELQGRARPQQRRTAGAREERGGR